MIEYNELNTTWKQNALVTAQVTLPQRREKSNAPQGDDAICANGDQNIIRQELALLDTHWMSTLNLSTIKLRESLEIAPDDDVAIVGHRSDLG